MTAPMCSERLRRTAVAFNTAEAPGTVIIDTGNTALYFVLGGARPSATASASAARASPGGCADHQPQGRMAGFGIRRPK